MSLVCCKNAVGTDCFARVRMDSGNNEMVASFRCSTAIWLGLQTPILTWLFTFSTLCRHGGFGYPFSRVPPVFSVSYVSVQP
uniref:Uncharacterized protein n=1 Tax=Tanacetum cinerariifolium TaxID=118510 RepID=A0A6L2JBL6_TANCI|nr:hypothetical protein [Tanacetum cinerariifolium]